MGGEQGRPGAEPFAWQRTWQPYPARLARSGGSRLMLALWLGVLGGGIVVAAVGFAYAVRFTARYEQVRATGVTMRPTYPDGATVMIRRTGGSAVRDGDVVLFADAGWAQEPGTTHLLRVVARGGDRLELRADGAVVVNGERLPEPYLLAPPLPRDHTSQLTVPEGRLYVLGDNRNDALDSRYRPGDTGDGTIAASTVKGVAVDPAAVPPRHRAPLPIGLALTLAGGAGLTTNAVRAKRHRARLTAQAAAAGAGAAAGVDAGAGAGAPGPYGPGSR